MSAHTRHRGLSALAVGTALSLGALGALSTSVAANAASIDTSQQGRIIIHKYENPGNGDQNPAGTGTDPTTAPVAGVVFEYCTVGGIDLFDGTNRGWDAVNAITATAKQAAAAQGVTQLGSYALSNCTLLPATDASGLATSAKLPLGVYFVREVSTPSNVVAPAAPFIVTLPTPADHEKLDGDWVYDVNLYPKNTVAQGPAKNVVDQPGNGVILGAPVTYQVTQLIPALAPGQTYDSFVLSDTLDPKLSPAAAVPVTVVAGTTTFVVGTDYDAAWTGQKLTVTFTAAGRAKLRAGMNVVLTFEATVTAPGAIENQAFVDLNDLSLTPGTPNGTDGSPSSTVVTRWGDLTVQKVNQAKNSDGLSGAKFRVYMGTTDQQSSCTADITGLQQVTTAGTNTPYVATSDGSGTIVIPGLWVGDTEKTVAADGTVSDTTVAGHDLQQRCYVLEEIAAPNGFVLPSGAAALTPVMVKAGANGTVPLVKIQNTQQGVPQLPFTGSSIQLAMTIGGIALLVVALGGVLVVRRRNTRREGA
ncbi:SpaH/EbpB family LPXTG-anchored major pilin [Leifsonia sp. 22587]|uniref:SpaH/EbpB family LPXTG-anchored major pilin n=1 Tax=Leifsonia sp. 22587 TaxID=3453946 RepID=UPI003F847C63